MSDYQQIIYEKQGAVVRVRMNRPRFRNAQSRILLEELDAAFKEAVADNDIRVIILSGEGDHFSSGHDLGTPRAKGRRSPTVLPFRDFGAVSEAMGAIS